MEPIAQLDLSAVSGGVQNASEKPVEYYTVRKGECLSRIAAHFHTKTEYLVFANKLLNRNDIKEGQELKIVWGFYR